MLNIDLFKGINESDMLSLLQCLGIKTKKYKKDMTITPFEKEIKSIGVVLSGHVKVVKKDVVNAEALVSTLCENDIFSEDIVCMKIKNSPISIMAASDCEVLFLEYDKILNFCSKNCTGHKKVIENLLKIIANKNMTLNLQIDLLGKRTIREKLLTYLKTYMLKNQNNKFNIPLNRNDLAQFLCVDRSAMSRELCNMRDEGLLNFKKNHFEML